VTRVVTPPELAREVAEHHARRVEADERRAAVVAAWLSALAGGDASPGLRWVDEHGGEDSDATSTRLPYRQR
jgi:hypothetical protein